MANFDLVIRGGTLVEGVADLGIAGGRIAQIGGDMLAPREIDAAGKLVLPGGVDAHVHLSSAPGETREPRWVRQRGPWPCVPMPGPEACPCTSRPDRSTCT